MLAATYCCISSVISGKIGSERMRDWFAYATGKSAGVWPSYAYAG